MPECKCQKVGLGGHGIGMSDVKGQKKKGITYSGRGGYEKR
jgi:hypothetical protein